VAPSPPRTRSRSRSFGSRRATPYGLATAERIAAELAARGVTIVSGLARGIDRRRHRGALEAGGRTLAVLGCGIDIVYPPENRALVRAIEARGALLSQFAPGTPALPGHFPARNRTLAGLALGVLVVEAADGAAPSSPPVSPAILGAKCSPFQAELPRFVGRHEPAHPGRC